MNASHATRAIVLVALAAAPVRAQLVVPPGFVDELIAEDLDRSVAFAFTPDGRILVAERASDLIRGRASLSRSAPAAA